MRGFLAVGFYLTSVLFSILLAILWLRVFLRYFHISITDPIAQFIYKFTNPLCIALESFFPKNKQYDMVCLFLILFMGFCKFLILGLFAYHTFLPITYYIILVVADFIIQPCNLLFYALLIRIILSWVNPHWQGPGSYIIYKITEPLIRYGHSKIPVHSGFDIVPFLILILLKLITLFITASVSIPLL